MSNGLNVGDQVLVRPSAKNIKVKLLSINEHVQNSDWDDIIKDLKEYGAIIKEINGANAKIQVLNSQKQINVQRLYLRRPKKKD